MIKNDTKNNQNAPKKQSPLKTVGDQAEALAKDYLLSQGLTFVEKQYRTKLGEIDLIMKDQSDVIFVEVRYRKNNDFGEPEETVTWHKQQRLIRTAHCYRQCHPWTYGYGMRFDVIGMSDIKLNSKIMWIPHAFGVE